MWSTVQNIAQLVASIATALGFIVVVVQLRHIRRQNNLEGHLNFIKSEREIWLAELQNENVAPGVTKSLWGEVPGVTMSEVVFVALLLDHFDHAYVRYRQGLITRSSWRALERYIVDVLSTLPAGEVWKRVKQYYHSTFVSHFDRLLRKRSA